MVRITALLALCTNAALTIACGDDQAVIPAFTRRQTSDDTLPSSDSPYVESVTNFVDSLADDLWPISQEIHSNPELGYQEIRAHGLLTDYLESRAGWTVTRSAFGINTSFVAVFNGGHGTGPVVSFNAEYDALQGLGHGCGHNLIAVASVAGALAAAHVMQTQSLPGKVVLFGTPAEESLGGKVRMLEAGAFSEHAIDISVMAHPTSGGDAGDAAYSITTATDRFDVVYHGKQAHAAAAPWLGVNAQDAVTLAYAALGLMRQQNRPDDRVHGRLATASGAINIIPDRADAQFQVRSDSAANLAPLIERFERAVEAGAVGTGATLNLTMRPYGYSDMVNNAVLTDRYARWFRSGGGTVPPADEERTRAAAGSTDQGNVSHEFPALHAMFGIYEEDGSSTQAAIHSEGFRAAARTRKSFDKAMAAAKALAGTAVDVLTVDGLLEDVRADFEKSTGGAEVLRLKRLRRRMTK